MASRPSFVQPAKRAGTPGLVGLHAFILLAVLLSSFPALAVDRQQADAQEPIVVTARTLVADNKKHTVTYRGDVVVKKGSVTLYAAEVLVRLGEPGKGPGGGGGGGGTGSMFAGAGKVRTIEASGGVKLVESDKTATSEQAVYKADSDTIVMTGSPRVWQGDNVLTGSRITYSLGDDTIEVEDARTVLYTEEEGGTGR